MEILKLRDINDIVTIGMNFNSKKLEKKSVIKISDRFLTKQEVDKIALIAPEANINIIKDYDVREKFPVRIPDDIHGIIRCVNANCITNREPIRTKFHVLSKAPLKLRCHYCERVIGKEDLEPL